jgi:ATP-binding cassette subfamily F protein uup
VATLSGGERNRLLLARLFTRPVNLLVLDEPTNDLDLETLEVLEDMLMEYQGALLLVSHDREFIDQVVTSVLVFDGQGRVNSYVGGYSDWFAQRSTTTPAVKPMANKPAPVAKVQKPARSNAKLSYKLSRELESLPELIESLEQAVAQQQAKLAAGDFYQQSETVIKHELDQLQTLEQELAAIYARWEELEAIKSE